MKTYETYVVEINEAVTSIKSSSIKLFELLQDAYSNLTTEDYKQLKKEIDVDKSTINKIEKIFRNDVIMNNIERLPVRWSTLHAMTMVEDEDKLQSAINAGEISSTTTRSDVKKLRDAKDDVATTPNVTDIPKAAVAPETNNEATATPSDVVISLVLKKELNETDLRKEIDYFAAQMSKEFFSVSVSYSNVDMEEAA